VAVYCHGWSFIVPVQFAGISCLLMSPSLILRELEIAVIGGSLRILTVKVILVMELVLKRETVKKEVEMGEVFPFHGLSIACFHLHRVRNLVETIHPQQHHPLQRMHLEALLKQMRIEYIFLSCHISFLLSMLLEAFAYVHSILLKVGSRKNKLCFNLSGFCRFFAFMKIFIFLLFHLCNYSENYFEWLNSSVGFLSPVSEWTNLNDIVVLISLAQSMNGSSALLFVNGSSGVSFFLFENGCNQ
jgi:hypothetical protein